LVTAGDFNCNLDSTDPISRYLNEFIARFLADRTATQYDWLLASSCCPSVRLSMMLCIVALRVGAQD